MSDFGDDVSLPITRTEWVRVPVFDALGFEQDVRTAEYDIDYRCADGHIVRAKAGDSRGAGLVAKHFAHLQGAQCRFMSASTEESEFHTRAKTVICQLWSGSPAHGVDIEGAYPDAPKRYTYDAGNLPNLEFYEMVLTSQLSHAKRKWLSTKDTFNVWVVDLNILAASCEDKARLYTDDEYMLNAILKHRTLLTKRETRTRFESKGCISGVIEVRKYTETLDAFTARKAEAIVRAEWEERRRIDDEREYIHQCELRRSINEYAMQQPERDRENARMQEERLRAASLVAHEAAIKIPAEDSRLFIDDAERVRRFKQWFNAERPPVLDTPEARAARDARKEQLLRQAALNGRLRTTGVL